MFTNWVARGVEATARKGQREETESGNTLHTLLSAKGMKSAALSLPRLLPCMVLAFFRPGRHRQ